MKKMIAIIIILSIIFFGMLIQRNTQNNNENVSIDEIEKIETYIKRIYCWKEITNEALPKFENINDANETWIWQIVKKDLEEYELTYDQIQNRAQEIFGNEFTKQYPKDGTNLMEYDFELDKYIATPTNLDNEEDNFLLDKIEKTKDGYRVEIIEYLIDYGVFQDEEQENSEIKIKNLNEETIETVKYNQGKSEINEIIKSKKEKFSKKILTLKKDENGNIHINKVE